MPDRKHTLPTLEDIFDDEFINALPEDTRYRDIGCEVSFSCLNCPLPRCKYEDPAEYHRELRSVRNEQICTLRRQGKHPAEIACAFGITKRTVYRALKLRNGF